MQQEEKKARIRDLIKQAGTPEETPPTPLKPLPILGYKVVIKGDMNHFAEGATQLKVVLVSPPAAVLISKAQKAALVERRDQWVDLHNTLKARQITHNDARKALNAKARVTAHRLIPAACYDDLMRWLDARIEALRRAEQRLTESNRRDLTPLKLKSNGPRDVNPDPDLTPPLAERPPPRLLQIKSPNAVRFVPNTTLTPGILVGNPIILCQTQSAGNFPPNTPQTLVPQGPAPSRLFPPVCANYPPPSQIKWTLESRQKCGMFKLHLRLH